MSFAREPRLTPTYEIGLKLTRAKNHLEELREKANAFFGLTAPPGERPVKPYTTRTEDDSQTGQRIVHLTLYKWVPHDWSLLVGEIAHGLRSALDNIAWALACRELERRGIVDPSPSIPTSFPILRFDPENLPQGRKQKTTDRLKSTWGRKVADLAEVDVALIDQFQPYKSPDPASDPLWLLSIMNNVDKHQRMTLAVAAVSILGLKVGFGPNPTEVAFNSEGLYTGPLQHRAGVQLLRYSLTGRNASEVKVDPEPTFAIQLSQASFPPGTDVIDTLDRIVAAVELVYNCFAWRVNPRSIYNNP